MAMRRMAVDSPIRLRGTGHPQDPARSAGLRFRRLFPAIILSILFHVGLFTAVAVKSWIASRVDFGATAEAAVTTPAQFTVGIDQGDGSGPGNSHSDDGQTAAPGAQPELPLVAMSQIPSPASATTADPLVGALMDAEESRAGSVSIGGPGGNGAGTGTSSGGNSGPGWGMGGNGGTAAYMRNPPPPYPPEAVRRRWEGTTVLRVEVLPDGTVGTIAVAESSGYSVLDQASMDTVRNWKFSPARAGDTPIRSIVEIPISFHLAGNQSTQPRD